MKTESPNTGETLSREFTDLLVGMANALHKYAMYPDGHPMLASGAAGLARQLSVLTTERPAIALGISPTQIIVAGQASDPDQALVRDLAARLHRRNVGALKLYRGAKPEELEELLRLIAREGEETGQQLFTRRWPHVRLHPLSYSQLELIGDPVSGTPASSWAATHWLTLASAALEAEITDITNADPGALARTIDARLSDEQYGARVAASLTDLLEAARARGGPEALALESRLSQLISAMAPETLQQLLALEPNEAERDRFVLEMSQVMAVDAVMDLVQAAAASTSRSLSPALVQLLGKMANYAQQEPRGSTVELAFRHQVHSLIEGWEDWDRKDPAPNEYQRTLDRLAAAGKSPLRGASLQYECEADRTVALSLEVGTVTDTSRRAAAQLLAEGHFPRLLELLDRSPNYGLATELRHQVVNAASLEHVLRRQPVDYEAVEIIQRFMGEAAVPILLDHLGGLTDPAAVHRVIELLRGGGDVVAAAVGERLLTVAWPDQRNLLMLAAGLPVFPAGLYPAELTRNEDQGIRMAALRILLSGTATRTRAICDALVSDDPATVRLGITAIAEHCPAAAVPLVVRQVEAGDLEPGVKAVAVRSVAGVNLPMVVDSLVQLATTRGMLFRRQRLAARSPVVVAAVQGLRHHWSTHPAARAVLDLARRSADPELRAAAGEA